MGAGTACLEKLQGLNGTEAKITIISREIKKEVQDWLLLHPEIKCEVRDVKEEDLQDRDVIFLATNHSETNKSLKEKASALRIWANSVDDPSHCDFYTSSLIDLGPVQFSISTDGKFAGLTAALRRLFEEVIPENEEDLFEKIFFMRKELKNKLPDEKERRKVLKEIISRLENEYFRKP